MTSLSVLLPVRNDAAISAECARAIVSVLDQTRRPDELVVITDGPDDSIRRHIEGVVAGRARLRLITEPRRNISEGLNRAMRACEAEFVARMDADDVSLPTRFEQQLERLVRDDQPAVVGTWARRVTARDEELEAIEPPADPARLRWRVVVENPLIHGSVAMRRGAVLEAGGYNETLARAQDHDLWCRMAERFPLANVPRALYRYTTPSGGGVESNPIRTREQAAVAASVMVRAWGRLVETKEAVQAAEGLMADWLAGEPGALSRAEAELDLHGPTPSLLAAYLRMAGGGDRREPSPERAVAMAQRARLREVMRELVSEGVTSVYLWGAGRHTRRILSGAESGGYPIPILGVIDDRVGARMEGIGVRVLTPDHLGPGDTVVLSSDWHEPDLWVSSGPCRARGVRVVPMYMPVPNEAPT